MLADTLYILGYRPEDDAWETDGRQTYIHDDNATRAWMISITRILCRQGWIKDHRDINLFRDEFGRIIQIEPCDLDCTGHYLHVMKAELLAS